jgi:hypothetical protein
MVGINISKSTSNEKGVGTVTKREQIDVLCVGDVVTDVFIKLLDDQAHTYTNEKGDWLAVPFGMKLPFHHAETLHAVGNAANAAVSFSRLGLDAAFETRGARNSAHA